MEFLQELWMPIVISASLVFIASSITHMMLPLHRGDYQKLPDEAKVEAALEGVPPGQYMIPYCTAADMNSPEKKARMQKGPTGTIRLIGPLSMGKNLGIMLLLNLLVSVFVAYQGHLVLPEGDAYLHVFRVTGVAAVMAYTFGWIPGMVWYGTTKSAFWAYLFDGVLYGLITAGTFGWLWPKV